MALIPVRDDPAMRRTRVRQLLEDGYLVPIKGSYLVLTERGLTVLMASADRPIHLNQLTKTNRALERHRDSQLKMKDRGDSEDV